MTAKEKNEKVALITGAHRGLGLETSKALASLDYTVIISSPVHAKAQAVVKSLQKKGLDVHFQPLDVTDDSEVKACKKFVLDTFGRLDVLVNNAGIMVDDGKSLLTVSLKTFQKVLDVNTFGALRLCQAFVPLMLKQNHGRIVNVASGRGQLSGLDIDDNAPSYCMSKAALNALTVMLSHTTEGTDVLVNSVCPGWCRTDMGGTNAQRSAKKGAETIVWLATLKKGSNSGGFYRDKTLLDW